MEPEFIAWLAEKLPPNPHLQVGVGDDAAVLRWAADADMVVTTDAITEGVDFRLGEATPEQIGHKALGVNLSDLAAMAAVPIAAVVSLVLPCDGALELAKGLYEGILPLAKRFHLPIAGGDTNTWEGGLVVSVTAIGRTTSRGALTRSGARSGDWLMVTGALGGSILGRHLAVEPRVFEAIQLHARYEIHAGIDISDGLALDASRLAAASNCGVEIMLEAVPISRDARQLAATTGRTPLDHALGDGEDFELLFAAPRSAAEHILRDESLGVPITRIGRFVKRPGLWQLAPGGAITPLELTGYLH